MSRRKTATKTRAVTWLSDEILNDQNLSNSFRYYQKFQFNNIISEIGDFVLVTNADAAEPDTESGCDAAKILSLYEDVSNQNDPFRAKVQWYSRPSDLPKECLNNCDIKFYDKEVVEDHRPFDTDISIETIVKKWHIIFTVTNDSYDVQASSQYICRYRVVPISRRKLNMEPVLEEERKAIQIVGTPKKNIDCPLPKTPSSLVKRMSRVSISEKNWSVSKTNGTKLLLKRAILADKNERESPKKRTSIRSTGTLLAETPKSSKKLNKTNLEEILSMELKENSDDELPTLIIRQHTSATPKRKTPVRKINDEIPKKVLIFEDDGKESYATRSGRVTRNPKYIEEVSPVKRTARRTCRESSVNSDEDIKNTKAPKLPKTPRTPKTPKSRNSVTKTPRSVSKRLVTSELTPSLRNRAHSVDNVDAFLGENKSLPGRENQLHEILSFIKSKILHGKSGCMYISGVPGTGKTATVTSALAILKEDPDLPEFQLIEVNGMRIAEPRQAYVQIYKQLTGKTVVWEQACALLEKRFTNPGPRRIPTVLLVDELDALCTRRQDVVYSVAEWAAGGARLAVLAVANTLDLPERALAARVASRLGLTRLAFPPYSHAQLQAIVAARLAAHAAALAPDAVQLIARKVAAVSGDARRALALCARALELAGAGAGAGRAAGLREVQLALGEAASSAAVRAIRTCSPAERLMLRAVAAEVERTGSDETTLSRALSTAAAIVALDGRPYRSAPSIRAPTPSQAHTICSKLASIKLLLMEPKPSEPRLLLNVSADDVHYATKQLNV